MKRWCAAFFLSNFVSFFLDECVREWLNERPDHACDSSRYWYCYHLCKYRTEGDAAVRYRAWGCL